MRIKAMGAVFERRLSALAAAAAVILVALAAAASPSAPTSGQVNPSPTAAARMATAPALDSEAAVRALLPPSIANSARLPVHKWGRADMPDAPGGYAVFIATVYPLTDDAGNTSEWLLANYLQWDGARWVPGLVDYPGEQLSGDDIWLARNLVDITVVASPPGQDYRVFTAAYTADGAVSGTLARTETLVEIYDLALDTAWSRIDYLNEVDTGDTGYTQTFTENVNWVFSDLDGDGVSELVATVNDTTTIAPTGAAPADRTPAPGTTETTSTEVYHWANGVFLLQRAGNAATTATPSTAAPANSTPSAAAPTATGAAPVPSPTQRRVAGASTTPARPARTPRPTRTPASGQ